MKCFTLITSMLATAIIRRCKAQTNTVAGEYPNDQTQTPSGAYLPISLDSTVAQQLAGQYKLIQAPNFAPGTHPAIIWTAFSNDIRQYAVAIQSLMASQIIVPYLDRLKDSVIPFAQTIRGFIGGTNGNRLMGVVPALVGTAQSARDYPLFTAVMDPDTQPYRSIDGRQFHASTKLDVIPNDISGPAVTPAAIDFLFQFSNGQYGFQQVNGALNQRAILPTGQCQRDNFRCNETFADIKSVSRTIKLYSPAVPSALTGSSGPLASGTKTHAASGSRGNGEQIAFLAEDCATAAQNVIVV